MRFFSGKKLAAKKTLSIFALHSRKAPLPPSMTSTKPVPGPSSSSTAKSPLAPGSTAAFSSFHRVPAWAVQLFPPRVVAVLVLLFFISQTAIGLILGPVVSQDLGVMQTFALVQPSAFRQLASKWGPEEVMRFERHFVLDFFIHPVIYTAALVAWTALEASQRRIIPLHYETWIGLIILAGTCDVIENILHYNMLPHLDQARDSEIRAAAVFSMVKWLITIPTGVWCLASFVSRRGRMLPKED